MMKRNERGQTLVLFVLLLPIFLVIMGIVMDMGNLHYEKRKIEKTMKQTISYGLDHIQEIDLEADLNTLLNKNLKNQKQTIVIDTNTITITVEKQIQYMFPFLNKKENETLKMTYQGILENNRKIVRGLDGN